MMVFKRKTIENQKMPCMTQVVKKLQIKFLFGYSEEIFFFGVDNLPKRE